MPETTVLSIRKFPAELAKSLKVQAAERRIALREHVIKILQDAMAKKGK